MHYFLQGERGVGKSFLLQKMLHPYQKELAGFVVSRLFQSGSSPAPGTVKEYGMPVGFRVQNIKDGFPALDIADDGKQSGVFLYQGTRDLSVLVRMMEQVEQDSEDAACKLILLDEIGGIELEQPEFMAPLRRILNGRKPCTGVWKSQQNLAHMVRCQGLEPVYMERHRELQTVLAGRGELHTFCDETREQCERSLETFLDSLMFSRNDMV